MASADYGWRVDQLFVCAHIHDSPRGTLSLSHSPRLLKQLNQPWQVFNSGFRRRRYSQHESRSDHLSASRQYLKPCGPKQYRNLVLRIALYPLASLTTFGVISIASLYLFFGGVRTASVSYSVRRIFEARADHLSCMPRMQNSFS